MYSPEQAEKKREYYLKNKGRITLYREQYYQKHKVMAIDVAKKYYRENREKIIAVRKKYRQENRVAIAIKDKRRYLKNKEKILVARKQYQQEHKEEISVKGKYHYQKHKRTILERGKQYYQENRPKILLAAQKYRQENKETIRASKKKYSKENREVENAWARNFRKTNLQYRLTKTIRSRLGKALKNNQKIGSAVRDLGCTIPELKMYLEGQFKDGMTWENWSFVGWHIDHKIPLAFFDLTDRKQFLEAVHYTNLQPMWARENIIKSNKYLV